MASATSTSYMLPDELSVMAAGRLSTDLADRRGSAIALNAGAVSFVGGLCLQVLAAARAAWVADGQPFSIENPSEAFTKDLVLLGGEAAVGFEGGDTCR